MVANAMRDAREREDQSDRPGLIAPGLRDSAGPIVHRGHDRIRDTPRARNRAFGEATPASGSECADRGIGVPNANPSREPDDRRWLETGVERKRI
jgi:hypothetical protein